MDYRDWLAGEIRRTEERLRGIKPQSPEWLMALHQLEILDECYRKYTGGERIVDEALIRRSRETFESFGGGGTKLRGTDWYWRESLLAVLIILLVLTTFWGKNPEKVLQDVKMLVTPPAKTFPRPDVTIWQLEEGCSTNSDNIVAYAPLLRKILPKLRENWHPASMNTDQAPTVIFRIDSEGKLYLRSLEISSSSGSKEVDQAAIQAVRNSVPSGSHTINGSQDVVIKFTFYINKPSKENASSTTHMNSHFTQHAAPIINHPNIHTPNYPKRQLEE